MDHRARQVRALSPEQRKSLARQRTLASTPVDISSSNDDKQPEEEHISGSTSRHLRNPMQFSIFFFSADEEDTSQEKYQLLLEAAQFADQHGFTAIWTPERHFNRFGGLYPNPGILSAALAMVTERLQIRAGSVVLPLHHPIRVAEDWSVVDNLSGGRIGLAFASGWSPDDFVLSPYPFAARKDVFYQNITAVQKLWRGEKVSFKNDHVETNNLQVFPRPVQSSLPIWISSSVNIQTCIKAGENGFNLLTALLNLSLDEVKEHIAQYRHALISHGHAPEDGHVTLMLHTFLSGDLAVVKQKVRGPLTNYLRTYLGSLENLAKHLNFPAPVNPADFSEDDKLAVAALGFERYFTNSGLFGTPASCLPMIQQLQAMGVDEIACLIDFGMSASDTMEGLHYLSQLKTLSEASIGVT